MVNFHCDKVYNTSNVMGSMFYVGLCKPDLFNRRGKEGGRGEGGGQEGGRRGAGGGKHMAHFECCTFPLFPQRFISIHIFLDS